MNKEFLNLALAITQQFGPERAESRESRLYKANSSISSYESVQLFKFCDEIESFAYDLAGQGRDKSITMESFSEKLQGAYPQLNEERLSTTLNQAMYYSLK